MKYTPFLVWRPTPHKCLTGEGHGCHALQHEGLLSTLPSVLKDLNRTCPSQENLSGRGRYGDQGDFLILILILWITVLRFQNLVNFSKCLAILEPFLKCPSY